VLIARSAVSLDGIQDAAERRGAEMMASLAQSISLRL
jgi:hypothetical protein